MRVSQVLELQILPFPLLETFSGENTFICEICGARFSQGDHLQQHQVTHTGDGQAVFIPIILLYRYTFPLITIVLP